ncbi:MAG: endolytic transglycosylase MltG [Micrococcales bacterium]|nr:endolytic transglycosylase MltG [Micrococcales bacterium]
MNDEQIIRRLREGLSAPGPVIDVDPAAVLRKGRRRRTARTAVAGTAILALFTGAAVAAAIAVGLYRPTPEIALPTPTPSSSWVETTSRLTIPEGLTKDQTFDTIHAATRLPVEDLRAAAADPEMVGLPTEAGGDVEGWLFPATYEVPEDASAAQVLSQMVTQTVAELESRDVPRDQWHDVLIKASLVEREAPRDQDRPMIARVVDNRLSEGMALDIDATALYGLGRPWGYLTKNEREDASNLYNTGIHPGLPPGPIASSGAASLDAVLHPADGDWLYWTVDPQTGEMEFSSTPGAHVDDIDYNFLGSWAIFHQVGCGDRDDSELGAALAGTTLTVRSDGTLTQIIPNLPGGSRVSNGTWTTRDMHQWYDGTTTGVDMVVTWEDPNSEYLGDTFISTGQMSVYGHLILGQPGSCTYRYFFTRS